MFQATQHFRHRILAAAIASAASAGSASAAPIFVDTFAASTVNGANTTPTAVSTSYQIASTKNATGSSIAPGAFVITQAATTSGLVEAQARFASSPINLANVNDYVDVQFTFTNTDGINSGGSSTINVGLYRSNGTNPFDNGQLANGGLSNTATTFVTGGVQNYAGFVGRVSPGTGTSSQIFTRSPQTDTVNENQDLLFNDVGSGAFDAPTGTVVASNGGGATLVEGQQYTYALRLTRVAGDLLSISQNLYDGATTAGTNLYSQSGTTADAASTVALEFDALAIGYRYAINDPAGNTNAMTVNSLAVTTNVVVPEPATLGVAGLASIGLLRRRRRR